MSDALRATDAVLAPPPRLSAAAAVPDVSFLIVSWNSARWIEGCLDALPAAAGGVAHETIVWDNGSSDGAAERAARPGVRVEASPSNSGFAGGTNSAAALARGRYLFLLNPDCVLGRGSVEELVRFLDAHPNASAAAPLLTDGDGDSQRHFQLRRFPTVARLASEVLLLHEIAPSNPVTARYRYADLDLSEPVRVEQPAAAALMVRRELFERIGGLDEQFEPAWFEDVDFCRRIAAAGGEIWVVPAAAALHVGGVSLEHVAFESFTEMWYRNMLRYGRKWFSPGGYEALRWSVIAGMLLRWTAAAVGVRRHGLGRREAMRAYASVARKALHGWSSPSS